MAVLYISEFSGSYQSRDTLNQSQIGQMASVPPVAQQNIAIGGSSTPSSAFGTSTSFIRVHTDAICALAFGAAPVAVATAFRMAADQTEYFSVVAGQKVAVITAT